MSTPAILLVSNSRGFVRHARLALGPRMRIEDTGSRRFHEIVGVTRFDVVIVQVSSAHDDWIDDAFARLSASGVAVAVATDVPALEQMLDLSRHGIRAYFNSYMAGVHYRQMIEMVCDGLSWFSPPMMSRALALARTGLARERQGSETILAGLTVREREIAADVAAGLSNREVAVQRHITERTVKAHLTRIFKKLGIRNRHALTVRLHGF